jgi:transcription initiation factor TFIID subunit 2
MADVKLEGGDIAGLPVPGFSVANQKVELDLDFSGRFKGRSEVTVHPDSDGLKVIRLDARQLKPSKITINGFTCAWVHHDPYDRLALHGEGGVNQHHILAQNIANATDVPPVRELVITIPNQVRIEKANVTEVHSQGAGILKITNTDGGVTTQALTDASIAKFTVLTVVINYESKDIRDGLQFTRSRPGNGRWPYAYTLAELGPGAASCLFPCLDALTQRCTWDISITCPKTVGDAKRQAASQIWADSSDEAKALEQDEMEMVVLCSGDKTDESVHVSNTTKKVVSFSTAEPLSAQQIGFAVGPFEKVKLSDLRDAQEDESLGQNAVEMLAYCLPGRTKETRNTCLPTPKAMDYFSKNYIACPFRTYSMCFVEDLAPKTAIFAGLSMCSTKLLYPEEVIDPAQDVTRALVHAIASQWMGISVVPADPVDTWAIVGISHFMSDMFMKELCGNNEYRYRMKTQADLICDLDRDRPSMYDLGELLHVHPAEYEFMATKAPVVLFVLDRRIARKAGRSKMPSIIAKILTRARIGELQNNFLSTDIFQKTIENFFHEKIDDFVTQWIKGAGCPRFQVFQNFNKKKLVVEMRIVQIQNTQALEKELEVNSFMRDVHEEYNAVWATPAQNFFTGSMTVRIHEADGTPYEHIVDINAEKKTFDVPYNTKYKRLKRSKRQKRAAAGAADAEEAEGESLVYCLGDVLQGEEEAQKWRLTGWSPDDEAQMATESYEWIRMDADFEWICKIQVQMRGYMFVSQLQQDRDVVAHIESVQQLRTYPPTPLVSSFLIRTVMDRRYFHGVRTLAARGLAKHATEDTNFVGLFHLKKAFEELFCLPDQDSRMARPNDFSSMPEYYLQCAIVEAMSMIRDENGFAPREVKEFLLEKLRFNDNSINDYSDAYYISRLMKAVCTAVAARPLHQADDAELSYDARQEQIDTHTVEQNCLGEIDRFRRMDEWTDSYQNLYSRTALECQFMLSKSRLGGFSAMHFLQYTRPGNFDMLRGTAYRILTESKLFKNSSILRYVLHSMITDPSPWLRSQIREGFGKAIAEQGLGSGGEILIEMDQDYQLQGTADGMVVQEGDEAKKLSDAAEQKRKNDIARRQFLDGPNGALESLKRELGSNESLKQAIWSAIRQPSINMEGLQELLVICRILYDEVNSLKVTLEYPRYWRVDAVGRVCLKSLPCLSPANRFRVTFASDEPRRSGRSHCRRNGKLPGRLPLRGAIRLARMSP